MKASAQSSRSFFMYARARTYNEFFHLPLKFSPAAKVFVHLLGKVHENFDMTDKELYYVRKKGIREDSFFHYFLFCKRGNYHIICSVGIEIRESQRRICDAVSISCAVKIAFD